MGRHSRRGPPPRVWRLASRLEPTATPSRVAYCLVGQKADSTGRLRSKTRAVAPPKGASAVDPSSEGRAIETRVLDTRLCTLCSLRSSNTVPSPKRFLTPWVEIAGYPSGCRLVRCSLRSRCSFRSLPLGSHAGECESRHHQAGQTCRSSRMRGVVLGLSRPPRNAISVRGSRATMLSRVDEGGSMPIFQTAHYQVRSEPSRR